jgi:hypothetical protein
VALSIALGSNITITEAMKRARQNIDLQSLGINALRPKRAVIGGLLLKVPGQKSGPKVDRLPKRLREALGKAGVTAARPVKRADMRVRDLDDSVTPEDVASVLAEAGGCPAGEIKIGTIRLSPAGLGSISAECPLVAARKLAAAGKVRVGWVLAYLEYLALRQLQCYCCFEVENTRQRCTSDVDRSGRCYRCADTSHRAAQCASAAVRCPLCADFGRPADHKMGRKACRLPPAVTEGEGGPFPLNNWSRAPREPRLPRRRSSGTRWEQSRTPQPICSPRSGQRRLPPGPAINRAERAAKRGNCRQDPKGTKLLPETNAATGLTSAQPREETGPEEPIAID